MIEDNDRKKTNNKFNNKKIFKKLDLSDEQKFEYKSNKAFKHKKQFLKQEEDWREWEDER